MAQNLVVKCYWGNEVRLIDEVGRNIRLKDLKKIVRKEFKRHMDLKYKDSEGDLIVLRKTSHLQAALAELDMKRSNVLKLHAFEQEDSLTSVETDILESLVNGAAIIDKKGKVLYFNAAAEKMFGYDRKGVIGHNVSMLMPNSDGEHHDQYLRNYLKTGERHVVGKGRHVVGQRKDGTTVAIMLSVSEAKGPRKHLFVGMMWESNRDMAQGGQVKSSSAGFAMLERILDCTIVINQTGTVLFFNKQAETFFGFAREEVLGRNVKMLMPSPFKEQHDTYLSNYMETGVPKVIGTGRDVVAQLKDGTIVPVNLSLTEGVMDGNRIFTGILRKLEVESVPEKSILQQEREVLENLVIPAVIIDEKGTIHAFNEPCQKLFGYTLLQVLGKNVSLLMPAPDRNRHDQYLATYLKTGKARVIGTGRDVVGLHKDGSMIAIHLSVTERKDGNRRLFTGILQAL
ncbi:PAS domain-containing sensor histidine kinase [Balamuthia mandrillaris]